MDLGKPLKVIEVAEPNAGRRAPAHTPPEEQPIPLPADWPRRRPAPVEVPAAAPARPAHE